MLAARAIGGAAVGLGLLRRARRRRRLRREGSVVAESEIGESDVWEPGLATLDPSHYAAQSEPPRPPRTRRVQHTPQQMEVDFITDVVSKLGVLWLVLSAIAMGLWVQQSNPPALGVSLGSAMVGSVLVHWGSVRRGALKRQLAKKELARREARAARRRSAAAAEVGGAVSAVAVALPPGVTLEVLAPPPQSQSPVAPPLGLMWSRHVQTGGQSVQAARAAGLPEVPGAPPGGGGLPITPESLSGKWRKDQGRSGNMGVICKQMHLNFVVTRAVNLIKGIELRYTGPGGEFHLGIFSAIPWFKLWERYPASGDPKRNRRRDLRRGSFLGAVHPQADQLSIRFRWPAPHSGSGHDIFVLRPGGELEVTTMMQVDGEEPEVIVSYYTRA